MQGPPLEDQLEGAAGGLNQTRPAAGQRRDAASPRSVHVPLTPPDHRLLEGRSVPYPAMDPTPSKYWHRVGPHSCVPMQLWVSG